MIILQIEHPVPDYNGWKKVFDNDPMGREKAGVKSFRISRPVDDNNYVLIELLFAEKEKAEAMLKGLQSLWKQVEGKVIGAQKARITEVIEQKSY